MNSEKTNFVVLINGHQISQVHSSKYLGLYIDDGLNWKNHIEDIYGKLLRPVGIFYKIRNKLPLAVLKTIYFAFVHSHILYGIALYANTGSTHLHKLLTLNNKLLRILQNKPFQSPTRNLYSKYNTLPIPDLHRQQSCYLIINLFIEKIVYQIYLLIILY